MRTTTATVLAVALSLNTAMVVAQTEHETHHPESAPPAETSSQASTMPMMDLMQQRLEEMQSHWEQMSQTQDPAERRKLIQEHREQMRELAATMRGMMHAQGMMPMVQRMEGMEADVDKLLETDDPQERQRLIQEHREKMRQMTGMMRGMRGGRGPMAMMGGQGGMMRGMMGAGPGPAAMMGDQDRGPMMGPQGGMMQGGPGQMAARLGELQADLDEILKTEDPDQREAMLQAYREKLQETLGMMGGASSDQGNKQPMMGGMMGQGGMPMMGGMMGQGGMPMMRGKGGMRDCQALGKAGHHHDIKKMHESVEKRLELIQRLLEQLLEYQIRY